MAMKTIKEGKNFKILQEGEGEKAIKLILVRNVRLSFPAVGHMKEDENDDGSTTKSYKATALMPQDTHKEAKEACVSLIRELCAENDAKVGTDKWFIQNGDDKERDEYEGMYVITCSDKKVRPTARDKSGERMYDEKNYENQDEREEALDLIDQTFYAGAIVDILIRPWFFTGKVKGKPKTFPKRVPAGFAAIKFVKDDGVRFSKGQINDDSVWGKDGDDGDDDDDPNPRKKPARKSSMDDDDDEL